MLLTTLRYVSVQEVVVVDENGNVLSTETGVPDAETSIYTETVYVEADAEEVKTVTVEVESEQETVIVEVEAEGDPVVETVTVEVEPDQKIDSKAEEVPKV